VTQILAYLGVHAEEELELKLGNDADCFLTRWMSLQIVTRCAGDLLKRATQVAISALWATFQQLKFGSSKVVPKDGDFTNTHPYCHVCTSTRISSFSRHCARGHESVCAARSQNVYSREAGPRLNLNSKNENLSCFFSA
jgi:hypothetical protein